MYAFWLYRVVVSSHQNNGMTKTAVSLSSHSGATRSLRNDQQHYGTFKIPEKIPAEDDWEPDYKHNVCMICKEVAFNMVNKFTVAYFSFSYLTQFFFGNFGLLLLLYTCGDCDDRPYAPLEYMFFSGKSVHFQSTHTVYLNLDQRL